jgi:hypothetical protein
MIHDKPKTSSLEMRKTFDSPLANHFSAVMQSALIADDRLELPMLDISQQ